MGSDIEDLKSIFVVQQNYFQNKVFYNTNITCVVRNGQKTKEWKSPTIEGTFNILFLRDREREMKKKSWMEIPTGEVCRRNKNKK